MIFVLSDSPLSHRKVASQIASVLSQHTDCRLVLGMFYPSTLHGTVIIVCSPHGLTNRIYEAIKSNTRIKQIIFYATNEGRLKPSYLPQAQYFHNGTIITPSEFCKKNFEADGFEVAGVIPHGVEHFGEPKTQNGKIFGYMGGGLARKYPEYGVRAVEKAVAQLNIEFRVIVDRFFRRIIDRNVDRAGFHEKLGYRYPLTLDKVRLRRFAKIVSDAEYELNVVTDEFILDFYRGLNWYLNLSDSEGFGITPLEAMAMGTPVIAPRYPPLTEFLPEWTLWVETTGEIWIEEWWGWLLIQHHHYHEHEMLKTIKRAVEMSDSKYSYLSRKSIEHAKKYDVNKLYVRFLEYV